MWSLAISADINSIQVSLVLCMKKQMINQTPNYTNNASVVSLMTYLVGLNLSQSQKLLYCDRDNRAHSQYWIAYTYLQTGQYCMATAVLGDLMLSHNISYPDNYFIPFGYIARGFIVTNVFFWVMYDKEKNQNSFASEMDKLLMKTDPHEIVALGDDASGGRFFVWSEASARLGMS